MKRLFTQTVLQLTFLFFLFSSISSLGQDITMDGDFSDWGAPGSLGTIIGTNGPNANGEMVMLEAFDEGGILYLHIKGTNLSQVNDTYLDIDCKPTTGYNGGNVWTTGGQGGDVLLQGSSSYSSAFITGNGTAFSWNFIGAIGFNPNSFTAGEITDIEYSFNMGPGCGAVSIGGCFNDGAAQLCVPEPTGPPTTATYFEYLLIDPLLPVELVSFGGKADHGFSNHLNWVTASETNNDYFIVQKSQDGVSWTDADKVEGFGTSYSTNYYDWTDRNPFESSYYRLKQVDFDGQFELSKMIHISNNRKTTNVTISPNPTSGVVTVQVDESYQIEEVRIYDPLGREITNKAGIENRSEESLNLDFSTFSNGLYYLRIGASSHLIQVLK